MPQEPVRIDGELKLSAAPRLGFNFHWLREVAPGSMRADFGRKIDTGVRTALDIRLIGSFLATTARGRGGRFRLRLFRNSEPAPVFAPQLSVRAGTPSPPCPEALAGAVLDGQRPERYATQTTLKLARNICAQAPAALARRYTAALSWGYQSASPQAALLDCTFPATRAGLRRYRQALRGDFTCIRPRRGALADCLYGRAYLELHLPFFDHKQWEDRWDALAWTEVEAGGDGRLAVHAAGHTQYQGALALAGLLAPPPHSEFTLSYTDARRLSPLQVRGGLVPLLRSYEFDPGVTTRLEALREPIDVSLTVSAPGALCAHWLDAPGERDPDFLPVYARVSRAVQRALRRWLPYLYFHDLGRYYDLGAAYALLVYQCMRPFAPRSRSQLTYDVLTPKGTGLERCVPEYELTRELRRTEQLLIDAGKTAQSDLYKPWRAATILARVERQPRSLNSLLVADTFFVDHLVQLGTRSHELRQTMACQPSTAKRELAKFCAEAETALNRKLRRLYAGFGFPGFGALLLVEATRVLSRATSPSAVLRVCRGARETTVVNPAFRPR